MKNGYFTQRRSVLAQLLTSFLLLAAFAVNAQVATNYTFASSSGTYTPITGGTVLGTTTSDDEVFNNNTAGASGPVTDIGFPIGFSFTYNGTSYSSFAVNNNGWIILGNGSFTIGSGTTALSPTGPNGYVSAIAGFARDLQGQSGSELSYLTIGSAPNRTLVVQWSGVRKYNNTGDNFNFQIRLNETSNTVEVVYGSWTNSTTSGTGQVGLRGNTNADFNNRTTTTNWAATNAGSSNSSSVTSSSTVFPASGLTYTWTPLAPCAGTPTAGSITGATTVCSGTGTTLTLSGATVALGITYQWGSSTTPGGPYTNMGTAMTQATGNLTATTYYVVTVTCTNGGATATTSEFTETVTPLPTVTVTPTSGSFCNPGGSPIALTASGASTYTWAPSTGLSATTGASVNAAPSSATTYTVTGTASGCTGTATAVISVVNSPSIGSVTATPSSVCSGASSQLQVNMNTPPANGYVFSASTGATLDPMAGATQVIGTGVDDTPTSAPAAIGFTFNFNGTNYTQYSVSPDGWILLGGATASGQFSNSVTSTTNLPKIYPYWDDLATGTTGNVTTLVTGTAPNRIFIVQWFVTIPRNTGGAANSTFQAWLYEGSNKIEFRYGAMGPQTSGTASAGITASATNYQSITFTSNTASTTAANNSNADVPVSGTMYTFSVPAYTYSWAPAVNLDNAAIANPLASNITSTTTYTVTVSGGSCSTTGTVTVTVAPLTSAATITPGTTACEGSTITLNATPAGGGSPYTYAWSGPNGFISTSQNPTLPVVAASAGTYSVTITDACGSTSTATVALTVNPAPTVSVTPTTSLLCQPGATAATLTASGSSTSYAWGPAAGLSATTGTSVTALPSGTTTYTVTGTGANGCTATATAAVTIGETPSISQVTATPMNICSGSNSQLQVSGGTTSSYGITSIPYAPIPTPGTGVTTLASGGTAIVPQTSVSLDDGGWANLSIPFNFVMFGTSYNSFAVATNGFVYLGTGSPATWSGYYNTFPSTLAARPVIGPVYSDLDFRSAGVINYFVTGTAPNRQLVINFSNGQFYSGSGSLSTQVILYESSNVIEIHTTNSTGGNSAVEGIQNATGTVAYVVTGRNSVTWTVTTPEAYRWSPTGGTLTYTWAPATFLNSTTISNPLASNVTATTTYSVTVDNGGCTANDSVMVIVGAPLVATTSAAPSGTVCSGSTVTLNTTSTGGGAPYTYAWTGPNSFTSTSQSPALTAVAASAGTYTVTVTDACGTTTTSQVTIAVNALPVIAVTPSTSLLCVPGATAAALTASGATSYTWSPSSGLSATTGATVNALPSTSTAYTVTGTDGNGCTATATAAVTVGSTPSLVTSATPSSVCAGDNSQLQVTVAPEPVSSYQFAASTGATLDPMAGATTAVTSNVDDTPSSVQTIGFTFNYNGTNYTQFSVSPDGWMRMGGTAASSQFTNSVTSNTNTPKLYPYWDDMATGTTGSVQYVVTGTAPNRILKVQWFVTIPYNTSGAANSTFQAWLYEGTNVIEFRYGTMGTPSSGTISGGLTGAAANFNSITFSSNTVSNTTANDANAVAPVSGTMYTFTPLTVTSYLWSPTTFISGQETLANPLATAMTATTAYTVQVTSSVGCTATGTASVTVNPLPTVTATPSNTTACSGNPTTLTVSGATNYTWTPAASLSASTGASVTASPTVTTTYTVTGVDGNSCSNTATVSITVNPLPVVTLAPFSAVCADAGLVALAGSESPSGGTFSGTGVSGTNFDPAAAGPGAHTITYTYMDAITGCSDTAMQTIMVNPLPVISFTAIAPVCDNTAPFTLSAASPAGGTYSGAGVSGGMFDPSVAGADTVIYMYTDPSTGCSSMDTTMITVNTAPVVTIASFQPVCSNAAPVTLTGESPAGGMYMGTGVSGNMFDPSVAGADTVVYMYTDAITGCSSTDTTVITVNSAPVVTIASFPAMCSNAAPIALTGESPAGGMYMGTGVTGNMFDPSVAGADTVMYMYTDAVTGCSNTDSTVITVNAAPVITLASYASVCEGSAMVNLTGESPAGGTYSGTGVSGTTFDPVAAGVGTFYIVYSYTDANSCSDMDSSAITVNANPVVNLGSDITQCGGTVTLNAGNAGSNYAWSPNGQTTQLITVSASGTYGVVVTDVNTCSGADTVTITINTPAAVNLGADVTICSGETALLDAGTGMTAYLWSPGGQTTQTITVSTAGQYVVSVTNSDNCSAMDTINVTVDPCIGIHEVEGYTVNIVPNPSDGMFMLTISNAEIAQLSIDIIDMQGQQVYNNIEKNISGDYTAQINITDLAKGVYYLRLNTGERVITKKLVIQ